MSSYARALVIPATAAGSLIVAKSAKFYLIAAASEDLIITVYKGSSQVGDVQGMGAGWADWLPDGFDRIVINTASGLAGTVTIAVGDDYAQYTTLTATVNVLDTSSPTFTTASSQGWIVATQQAAVAGDFCYFKIRNPAASGFNIFVKGENLFAAAAGGVLQQWLQADTGLNYGTVLTPRSRNNIAGVGPAFPGVASGETTAAPPATLAGSMLLPLPQAGTPIDISNYPFEIQPGDEMVFKNTTVNSSLSGYIAVDVWPVGVIP